MVGISVTALVVARLDILYTSLLILTIVSVLNANHVTFDCVIQKRGCFKIYRDNCRVQSFHSLLHLSDIRLKRAELSLGNITHDIVQSLGAGKAGERIQASILQDHIGTGTFALMLAGTVYIQAAVLQVFVDSLPLTHPLPNLSRSFLNPGMI
nr:MAG TPA: hypothetical protein [Bacteriophage sp.]